MTTTVTNLDHQRDALKASALVSGAKMIATNRDFYRWLATAYLWWVDAAQQPGYLDKQYETLGKRFKKNTSSRIHFVPALWLLWGLDNGLTDDKALRWSRVLNVLDQKYNSEEQYRTDSVAKLANFIAENGGVDGLAGYGEDKSNVAGSQAGGDTIPGSDELGDEEVEESDAYTRASTPGLKEHTSAIYDAATSHYKAATAPVVQLKAQVDVNSDGLGVVVVRQATGGYQVLGANSKQTVLEPLLTQSYLGDFTAAQNSTRAVYETLATQCLPAALQKFYRKLVDNGAVSSKGKAVRRLMYRAANGDLILSPIRSASGVVTVAKLNHDLFADLTHDCFLATYSRRVIEAHLIAGRNINLYTATHEDLIQPNRHGSTVCHSIQVKHKYAKDSWPQHWWPFESSVVDRAQLVVDEPALKAAPFSQETVDATWIRRLASNFTEKWLVSHGKHITREHQKVLGIELTADELTVRFVMQKGVFVNTVSVPLDKPQLNQTGGISVKVRSKDWAVAVQAIADINPASTVSMSMDADMVIFAYETDAATYTVYVPTCNEHGTLSTKYLTTYEPPVYVDEDHDHDITIHQPEGDFTEAE